MGRYSIISKPSKYGLPSIDPEMIVIHAMGQYIECGERDLHAYEFLETLGLSAHFLVDVDGSVMVCRNTKQGAYHAKGYNEVSIGIEFLVKGVHTYGSFLEAIKKPYLTKEQYDTGVELVNEIIDANMNIHTVERHSVLSPARKFDPAEGFPWERFCKDIKI